MNFEQAIAILGLEADLRPFNLLIWIMDQGRKKWTVEEVEAITFLTNKFQSEKEDRERAHEAKERFQ